MQLISRKFDFCRVVFAAALGVGFTFAQSIPTGTQELTVNSTGMVWDATRAVFWVATTYDDPKYPNSILQVDPATAQITDQIGCGQTPGPLAISADGQYLYAGFGSIGAVYRYPLPSHTSDLQIVFGTDNFGTLFATALAVLPNQSGSFVAALADNAGSDFANTASIAVYDASVRRPNTAAGPKDALFIQSPTSVDAWGAGVVASFTIGAQGVTFAAAEPGLPLAEARPFNGNRYVTDDWGYVFDTNAGMVIGRAAGILRCVSTMDQGGDAILAVNTSGTNAPTALTSYSLSTFRPIASMPLVQLAQELQVASNSASMQIWGGNGIAINTGVHLVFLQLSSLQPVAGSPPTPTVDPSGAIRIPLQTGGLAFDSTRNHLLASVAGISGGTLGNTIAQIDPASGHIVGSIFAGSEPGPISLTDDGSRVFTGLAGAPMVVPVNLQSMAAEQPYPVLDALPPLSVVWPEYNGWFVEDLVTLQGAAESVAVVRSTDMEGPRSIVVYDSGVARPNILEQNYLADRIYRADAADALFSLDLQDSSFALNRLLVGSNGIAIDRQLIPIVGTFNGTFAYESGDLYSSDGTIWTGAAPTEIGAVAGDGVPVPFPDQNAVAYASVDNYGNIDVWLFALNTYRPLSSIKLPTTDLAVLSAVRTGTTSFALRTASEVILISWSNLQAWPSLTPTLQSVAPGIATMPFLANAIAAAPDGANLLVATSSVAGNYGNCVLTVNPNNANILASGYVGSEPVELSVVPGDSSVYASVSGEIGIAHFNLSTSSRDYGFTADPTGQGNQYEIWDIAAAADGSVAASFYNGSVAAFAQGQLRPNADLNNESFAQFSARQQLAFSSSGSMLYGYDQWVQSGIRRMRVSSSGIQGLSAAPGLTVGYSTEIRSAGTLLYTSIGDVIDPERSRRVAQFIDPNLQEVIDQQTVSKHVWPDLAAGRVYFIAGPAILVFDMYNFAEIGSLTLPTYSGEATALVKVGTNLAFLTSTGDVWVVSIASIPSIAHPVPPPPVLLPSTPGVGVIDLAVSDLAYNAANNLLYVTAPNSEAALGDSALALDPGSGAVAATYFGAVNPHLIRVSGDGSTAFDTTGLVNNGVLYVGEGLRSINLSTGMASPEFATLPPLGETVMDILDMAPLAGQPGSIAVLNCCGEGSVRVYDGAVQRPVFLTEGCSSLQPGANASRLYCYDGATSDFSFYRLAVDQNGVSVINSSGPDLIGAFNVSILYYQGLVYTTNGRIIDPENLALVGTVPASGSVAIDSGLLYYLSPGTSSPLQPPTVILTKFDLSTLQQVQTRTINVSTTATTRLVPCGQGRLAFGAGQQVYIVYPTSSEPGVPAFSPTGVVSSASFAAGASGGELVSIFGQNLVRGVNGVVSAAQLPLPTELGGTSVTIAGIAAPLLAVSGGNGSATQQINLQVPFELAGQGALPVIVNAGGVLSQPVSVSVAAAHPGVFMAGGTQAIVTHANYSLVNSSSPASPGEVVTIFCTGLGAVTPGVTDGGPAPGSATWTVTIPVVTIGGLNADVLYSGLAPGFAGLYQINAQVPGGAQAGSDNLSIALDGAESQPVRIAIQ
jgi:uncharacterized protein (TIGR03437 family)